jgi:hypothetical protein
MAKTKLFTDEAVDSGEESGAVATMKTSNNIESIISLMKYFEIHRPEVHPYTRAYIEAAYRGILKTREEWDAVVDGNGV